MARATLSGRVAIVSGSNSGIGASIARELSAGGASVIVNYPHVQLSEEAHNVSESVQSPSIAVEADVYSTDGPARLVESAVEKFGRLDIVVNNAALAVNAPLEELTLDHWDELVNFNGRGVFLLTQAALKHIAHGSGRIVNIVSVSARAGSANADHLRQDQSHGRLVHTVLGQGIPPKYGCTVNAVSPGPTMMERFLAAGKEAMKILQPAINATPVGKRMADPSEIAYAVAFLCEERARWINGEHLYANDGLFVD